MAWPASEFQAKAPYLLTDTGTQVTGISLDPELLQFSLEPEKAAAALTEICTELATLVKCTQVSKLHGDNLAQPQQQTSAQLPSSAFRSHPLMKTSHQDTLLPGHKRRSLRKS